jgi:intergrase/recombinase
MTEKRLVQIAKRIEKIKADLVALEAMRPGSLTRQYKDPQNQTGSYYQLSYTREMKSRTDYIPRDHVREVRRLIANYKRFKALTVEWVDLSIEQSRLSIRLARNP